MMITNRCFAFIALLLICCSCATIPSSRDSIDRENASLPKVLIIGDSISLGYTPFVIEGMANKAIVTHHEGNAGPTMRGIENIESWLGDGDWDVIQFNWGLWDMYGWRYYDIDRSPGKYESRLEVLVTRLEQSGASLIWATTTPVCPDGEMKEKVKIDLETEKAYLETASRIMKSHGIEINDLHGFMESKRERYAIADDDVHYTEAGYRALAKQVSKSISQALARN